MKLEIIRDKEYNKEPWYILKVNNITVDCSRKLEEMELLFEKIKEDPSIINPSKIVLKSEEISLSL